MRERILQWIFDHPLVAIFVLITAGQVIRAFFNSRKNRPAQAQAKPDELEGQRRVQEIQEQIRRRIAERRGGQTVAEPSPRERTEPGARASVAIGG